MKPSIFIDGQEGATGLRLRALLAGREDIRLLAIDPALRKDAAERRRIMGEADLVFLCLPDAAARAAVELVENPNTRIIDASTAHRVSPGWVYGFPELTPGRRAEIAGASRVSNPGCYATGFLALVRPLVERGILPADYPLTAYGLSGYTGAGREAIARYEDPGRDTALDSPRLYALSLEHKHLPEMTLHGGLARRPIFTPVICDYPRGMAVTVPLFLPMLRGVASPLRLREAYADYYAGARFVSVSPAGGSEDGFLGANLLQNTNGLQIHVCGNSEQAAVHALLDNLGKGASGAAVQNMNLMLGLPEETGLLAAGEQEGAYG